jgi:hypothetical protein
MSLTLVSPVEKSAGPISERDNGPGVADLDRLLGRLRGVLVDVPEAAYRLRPARGTSGSIGDHVRDLLGAVRTLLGAEFLVELTYDGGMRSPELATRPDAAVSEIDRLLDGLAAFHARALYCPVRVRVRTGRDANLTVDSTIGRELGFVLGQAAQQCTVIALLLDRLGIDFSDDLPAPVRH